MFVILVIVLRGVVSYSCYMCQKVLCVVYVACILFAIGFVCSVLFAICSVNVCLSNKLKYILVVQYKCLICMLVLMHMLQYIIKLMLLPSF